MGEGKVRAVGVSNFNLDQMVQLLDVATQGDVKPAVLQSNSGEGWGVGLAPRCEVGSQ